MLQLQVGSPGSGKSYEATVYQILPALQSGRKVITNLPINIHVLRAISPEYASLLEIRNENRRFIGRMIKYYENQLSNISEGDDNYKFISDTLNKLKQYTGRSRELIVPALVLNLRL